jgi:hypothetical protein
MRYQFTNYAGERSELFVCKNRGEVSLKTPISIFGTLHLH